MTSEERREARYQRRKAKRIQKQRKRAPSAGDYTKTFSFGHLWRSYRMCRKNVAWKGSVQRYIFAAPIRVAQTYHQLIQGKYKCVTPHEWDTWERGKKRHIKSVPIGERVMQRCLADNALTPTLSPTYVYDNGACLKDKGYDFAMRRLVCHLSRYYRKHGSDGYILLFDFTKFYENIDHAIIRKAVQKQIPDWKTRKMVDNVMATFGETGLGLGSQISQILALASANELDHAIKQDMGIKYYARYNDDGYLIHPSKEYLKRCLEKMQSICDALHIRLNMKKTQIVKLSHGFKFIQARIFLTKTGKVLRKVSKKRITVQRRKLKKLKKKLVNGVIDMPHIAMQYQSWRSSVEKYFSGWRTLQNMDRLYKSLFFYNFKEAVA